MREPVEKPTARADAVVRANLTLEDAEMFGRFGITDDLLDRAQIRRVTDAGARRDYGIRFAPTADLDGLMFPYFDPETGSRVTARPRRDRPEVGTGGKPENKYLSPWGDNRHLYFPPAAASSLKDVGVTAVFVEAEKSALALTALAARTHRKMLAIATGGCWAWRGKTGIEAGPNGERVEVRGPLPDFGLVAWKGRRTLIAFDSNAAFSPQVSKARDDLADFLTGQGASVWFVSVPEE